MASTTNIIVDRVDDTPGFIFVIMPFMRANERREPEMTKFFFDCIKKPIEQCQSLTRSYMVARSAQHFDINDRIIKDLFRADVVIADLSGPRPNPNVMYEYGVRLALGNRPVIPIRESHEANLRLPFDIQSYFTFQYDPHKPGPLAQYLIETIKRYENGQFRSPVVAAIAEDDPLATGITKRRAYHRLVAVYKALLTYNVRTAVSVTHALDEQVGLALAPNPATLMADITGQPPELLEHVDWDSIHLRQASIPALSAFLEDDFLRDHIPQRECGLFYEFASMIDLEVLHGVSPPLKRTATTVVNAIGHCVILATMAAALLQYMRGQGDKDRSAALETFWLLVSTSNIQLFTKRDIESAKSMGESGRSKESLDAARRNGENDVPHSDT